MSVDGDLAAKFAAGLNVNAAVFVPSWAAQSSAPSEPPVNGVANGVDSGEAPTEDWDKMEEEVSVDNSASNEVEVTAPKENFTVETEVNLATGDTRYV